MILLCLQKNSEQSHIEAVTKVLERIKEKGLVLSQKKSHVLQTEVEYLGLNITKNGNISLTLLTPRTSTATFWKNLCKPASFMVAGKKGLLSTAKSTVALHLCTVA